MFTPALSRYRMFGQVINTVGKMADRGLKPNFSRSKILGLETLMAAAVLAGIIRSLRMLHAVSCLSARASLIP